MASEESASTQFLNFLTWLHANQKRVLMGAGIVAFVIIVAAMLIHSQSRKEIKASEALSEIHVPLNPGKTPRAGLAEEYLKFSRDYAGTKAAARAIVQGAGVLYAEGRYAEAQKEFERLLRDYPESAWVAEAHLAIAASLEAQQKAAEAIAKYEQVRSRFANAAIADEAKLGLGRLYESSNPAEAYKLYDELLKANPYSGLGAEAGMRQAELVEKHPEVKPKPPAPIMPSVVMTNRPMGSNQVITISNFMQQATNLPKAATNVPAPAGTNVTTATNAAAPTNIQILVKPAAPTNNP